MNILKKIRVIAEAKFADKSNLGDWYTKRLEICEMCPVNSKNKENLTVKEKAIVAANLGKPACLACGCEIAAKAYVREEECGLAKIGELPLWQAITGEEESEEGAVEKATPTTASVRGLKIENLSPDKVRMYAGVTTVLDYGSIPYNSDTKITLRLQGESNRITNFQVRSSCQCTAAKTESKRGVHTIKVDYNSKIFGAFSKTVYISYYEKGNLRNFRFNLKGDVIK